MHSIATTPDSVPCGERFWIAFAAPAFACGGNRLNDRVVDPVAGGVGTVPMHWGRGWVLVFFCDRDSFVSRIAHDQAVPMQYHRLNSLSFVHLALHQTRNCRSPGTQHYSLDFQTCDKPLPSLSSRTGIVGPSYRSCVHPPQQMIHLGS